MLALRHLHRPRLPPARHCELLPPGVLAGGGCPDRGPRPALLGPAAHLARPVVPLQQHACAAWVRGLLRCRHQGSCDTRCSNRLPACSPSPPRCPAPPPPRPPPARMAPFIGTTGTSHGRRWAPAHHHTPANHSHCRQPCALWELIIVGTQSSTAWTSRSTAVHAHATTAGGSRTKHSCPSIAAHCHGMVQDAEPINAGGDLPPRSSLSSAIAHARHLAGRR